MLGLLFSDDSLELCKVWIVQLDTIVYNFELLELCFSYRSGEKVLTVQKNKEGTYRRFGRVRERIRYSTLAIVSGLYEHSGF